ncbi:uncharacterized protein K460DRAFT_18348 [Cucurbitaria berberidis CBS 394.84]|uniref:Uncharacterized protein n=1 Tax=Cucurbitaria berberidis CBS 394.84 TaxID=1168544 RepID=A0A9P4GSS1_9PLEO|nr:uncharacterized protein K460DRAFT_18348 [Cucurbitaria berberidis CBS 394.84]KAF1850614.1 hypothetical protein K460DRAFT_18348 [Cucurbitaria berberidis CBS 394.84]
MKDECLRVGWLYPTKHVSISQPPKHPAQRSRALATLARSPPRLILDLPFSSSCILQGPPSARKPRWTHTVVALLRSPPTSGHAVLRPPRAHVCWYEPEPLHPGQRQLRSGRRSPSREFQRSVTRRTRRRHAMSDRQYAI